MTARWTIRKVPGGAAAVVAATILMLACTAGATTLQDLLGRRPHLGRGRLRLRSLVPELRRRPRHGGAGVNYHVTGGNPQGLPLDAVASAFVLNYVTITAPGASGTGTASLSGVLERFMAKIESDVGSFTFTFGKPFAI